MRTVGGEGLVIRLPSTERVAADATIGEIDLAAHQP